MPYPELMVTPMREELSRLGVTELKTAAEVDEFLAQPGSSLIVFNSVCGCAAGMARPSVALALQHANKPDHLGTVFAGQDTEATARAREMFPMLPPSSPSMIIAKDGQLVEYIPRHRIEGRDANSIANDLIGVFDKLAEGAASQ
ncbi:MAG: BrxA/BrxB family bacilliredoxin [Phycisphaera sp.]|nr:BrxA/BrxB family bacilliredoxin [Phycisphaera sp.]